MSDRRLTLAGLAMAGAIVWLLCACATDSAQSAHFEGHEAGDTNGERIWVEADAVLVDELENAGSRLDYLSATLGHPRPVVARGSLLRTIPWSDVPATSHPSETRWRRVEVVRSPIEQQIGWRGYIHSNALSSEEPVWQPPGWLRLRQRVELCVSPVGTPDTCRSTLESGTPLEIIGCEPLMLRVGVWTDRGYYLNGYVRRATLWRDPC